MSDGFSLNDALSGSGAQQTQGQNLNNPWGGQNPGYPGQPYPGFPGQGQGQQYPGYPGFPPGAPQGQQYPGAPQGQQYPGAPQGQQYPGAPSAGQQYPGYPGQPYAAGATTSPTAPIVPPGPKQVPCALPLPSGCAQGMMLTIQGVPTGNRFSIDFVEGNDVAFHFNPRFNENPYVVVRNSLIQGKWGQEERQCPKFPFQMQQPFKLQILFETDGYKVSVNNENLCKYPHRLKNFAGIKTIRLNGDVTINDASVTMV